MFFNQNEILEKCLDIVRQSGRIIADSWNRPHDVRHKGFIDLVTETDVAVEKFLRKALMELMPQAAFVGEESAHDDLEAELQWIVDPVDGTTNFVHRIPVVGTSVALCQNGKPVLGIVNAPMLNECYHAVKGGGAFLNGKKIAVSDSRKPEDCLVATGFPYEIKECLPQILGRLENVLPACQGLRRLGAASIDLAYVACGRLDAFYETGLKAWDMAAGWLLVEEAGGKASDFDGNPLGFNRPLIASNGHLHEAMLKLLK